MREYTITKCTGAPDWRVVPSLGIDCFVWCDPVNIRAEAQLCYDDNALYVRLRAWETHIRAVEDGPLGSPWVDSCLEFFFRPDPNDTRYFNIEFNPNGCMFLGFTNTPDDMVRLLPKCPPIVPEVAYLEDGWSVSYQVPYSFICHFFPGFHPVSGSTIRANCYKCGELTPEVHFMTWNPLVSEIPSFHLPEQFGLMRFE